MIVKCLYYWSKVVAESDVVNKEIIVICLFYDFAIEVVEAGEGARKPGV